jgi:hypothetical protein
LTITGFFNKREHGRLIETFENPSPRPLPSGERIKVRGAFQIKRGADYEDAV